jgi:hypothetical protein
MGINTLFGWGNGEGKEDGGGKKGWKIVCFISLVGWKVRVGIPFPSELTIVFPSNLGGNEGMRRKRMLNFQLLGPINTIPFSSNLL